MIIGQARALCASIFSVPVVFGTAGHLAFKICSFSVSNESCGVTCAIIIFIKVILTYFIEVAIAFLLSHRLTIINTTLLLHVYEHILFKGKGR